MGSRGKIITTLRQRREIEQQIWDLLDLKSQSAISERVDRIVARGEDVISTLLANLNTSNPHFRGALGLIAARLPREAIVPALRSAALNESLPDQTRLTAVMILERFLDEPMDATSLTGLTDPRQMALQSLLEVASESRRDRSILIEYVRSFREQPSEVAELVLQSLDDILPEDQIDLLRMLAQDERAFVRERAVAVLGRTRTAPAGRALQVLLPTVPAELQPALERAMRKLSLAGVPVEPLPPPDPTWRVLVSPVDGEGNQSVWFLQEDADSDCCRFLSLLISDRTGLKDAFGGDRVIGQRFPAPSPAGTLHTVPLYDNVLNLNLLEADFDYGRRLVLQGLETSFGHGTPLPIEYRLLSDLLWSYSLDRLERTPRLPDVCAEEFARLLPHTARLLELTDFATWFVQSPAIIEHAERLRAIASSNGSVAVPRQWLADLASLHFQQSETRGLYAGRLRAMSEWLLLSRQDDLARLALVAAMATERVPPAEHPFLLQLTQISLGLAIGSLSQGMHLRGVSSDE